MSSLVSIIMPCYNAEENISEAIASVLNQTHTNWELIIVNDGSTDTSEEKVMAFADSRIRYFKQENRGQCGASNAGLEKAKGDYIKFFDADDVMNPEHIAAQLSRLKGTNNCVASCAWGRFYDGNPASAKFIPEPVWKDMKTLDWLKASLHQKYDMMGAWVWLIPASLIKKAGGWDERLSLNNDFEFSVRLLLNAEMVLFAEDARMFYRSGSAQSLSQKSSGKQFEAAILSTNLGCSYLLKAENSDEMRRLCANRYQEWLFRVYPDYPGMQKELKNRIAELGGSDRKLDGGKASQFVSSVLGWRASKRFRMMLEGIGYKKLPWN